MQEASTTGERLRLQGFSGVFPPRPELSEPAICGTVPLRAGELDPHHCPHLSAAILVQHAFLNVTLAARAQANGRRCSRQTSCYPPCALLSLRERNHSHRERRNLVVQAERACTLFEIGARLIRSGTRRTLRRGRGRYAHVALAGRALTAAASSTCRLARAWPIRRLARRVSRLLKKSPRPL